jgi:hypothetical protein
LVFAALADDAQVGRPGAVARRADDDAADLHQLADEVALQHEDEEEKEIMTNAQ